MFRIKICGVTNVPDAITAVDAGADAIGLNFYEKSKRWVTVSDAEKICGRVGNQVLRVGVFVNPEWFAATKTRFEVGLDAIQLHGDERPSEVARFAKEQDEELLSSQVEVMARFMPQPLPEEFRAIKRQFKAKVIWARRIDERGPKTICRDLEECKSLGAAPITLLLDSAAPGAFGGTGHTAPWLEIAECSSSFGDTPLILAGGLTPDNVAEAIRIVRPHGVDVASGVESAPGKKDPVKVRDFIAAARAAFGAPL